MQVDKFREEISVLQARLHEIGGAIAMAKSAAEPLLQLVARSNQNLQLIREHRNAFQVSHDIAVDYCLSLRPVFESSGVKDLTSDEKNETINQFLTKFGLKHAA